MHRIFRDANPPAGGCGRAGALPGRGQRFVSPAIAQELAWLDPQAHADPLSEREREVLVLVAEGLGSDAIAARLGIRKRTVDNHRANIRKKLNLNNAAKFTRYALENGLLSDPGSRFRR